MAYPTLIDYTFQQWDESNSGVTTTTARDTTGATDLRVWTICASVSVPTITDSKGNTWVEDDTGVIQVTASSYMRCFKATGTVVVGTAHTFTSTLAAANNHLGMIALKPTTGGATLTITALDGVRDLSSPFTSPTISPSADATLFVVNGNFPAGTQTITWGDSFTKLLDVSGANRYASSLAYREVTGGSSYSASHTSTASLSASAVAILSVTETGGTPPVLSTPGRDNITSNGVRITGTSDIGSGTFYVAASTSATPPSAAQIIAGSGGSIVAAASSSLVAGSNAATITSGLTADTTYYGYAVANNGSDSNVISTTSFTTLAQEPVITGVSDLTPQEGDALVISSAGGATGFSATQGSVSIGGASATITNWSDTSVTAIVPIGTNAYGTTVNVTVTNGATSLTSAAFALTSISPPTGYAYVNITSINPTGLILTAAPDIAIGDQVEYETLAGDVEVLTDCSVTYAPTVPSFDFRVWTTGDGWGSWGTITTGVSTDEAVLSILSIGLL